MTFVTSVFNPSQLPVAEYPEIAFAGRSNVGKSSLINKLVGRKSIVKVSSKPGKTRSLNYFLVDQTLYLVD
ncbi:MAG: 50S ribosome-binding GTPase, partial [Desulfobulbaceae bacterium]|nr:50S ribosome-binding GTPase [Desulfobulbaceae bacterium]